jgi:hypothetical protein
MMADENIKQLCLQKDGLLVLEFERIFHDLFNGKGTAYKKILNTLKDGMRTLAEIRQEIAFAHSGTLSTLMEHLITAGFVQKQRLRSFKTGKILKQSLYRISDPYIRFYFKVIEPNIDKISTGDFANVSLSTLPGLDPHLGLQLEHLLLQNRQLLLKAIGINPADIVWSGPYRQSKTTTQQGCQIDYLVQTATNSLLICEFKFKRAELGNEIIDEMNKKIKALKTPKGFVIAPVLFNTGGVTYHVGTSNYFYRIIDIADFLQEPTIR